MRNIPYKLSTVKKLFAVEPSLVALLTWGDSVCINQEDLDERSHQVGLMVEIYSRSSCTVAWLGPASHDSDVAISWIRAANKHFAVHSGTNTVYPLTDDERWHRSAHVNIAEDETDAVASLLSRPWFERLWIWQEIIFSDERAMLKCGKAEIAWKDLCVAIWCFEGRSFPGSPSTQRLLSRLAYLVGRITPSNVTILETLNSMRPCDCTDQRDRIYTAQVFHEDKPHLRVTPDYRRSARDVYTDFVLRYVDATQDLEFFGFIEHQPLHGSDRTTVGGLPSWVPNWSLTSRSMSFPRSHASLGAGSATQVGENELKVKGIRTSTVQTCHRFSLDLSATGAYEDQAHALRAMIVAITGPSPTNVQLDELCCVLTANTYAEIHVPDNPRWPRLVNLKKFLATLLASREQGIKTDPWTLELQVIAHVCLGRSLFQTDTGVFGLGPDSTEPGDSVTVIIGCGLALVLRLLESGHYQVIGASYCDGMMCTEAFIGPLPSNYRQVKLKRQDTYYYLGFQHLETCEAQLEDPRLPELPPEWKEVSHKEGVPFLLYKNIKTEEFRPWFADPRCDAGALEKRGVELQEFVRV